MTGIYLLVSNEYCFKQYIMNENKLEDYDYCKRYLNYYQVIPKPYIILYLSYRTWNDYFAKISSEVSVFIFFIN
jgi:hypothetical protein